MEGRSVRVRHVVEVLAEAYGGDEMCAELSAA